MHIRIFSLLQSAIALYLIMVILVISCKNAETSEAAGSSQQKMHTDNEPSRIKMSGSMPMFVIERQIPDAGRLSSAELKDIATKSCGVLTEMGPQIQWIQSFVTDDKIYCVYTAPDSATVMQHALKGGFPANKISIVKNTFDPTAAK
jgi:hypothetical protein